MTRNPHLRTSKLAATAVCGVQRLHREISISSTSGFTASRCCQLKLLSQRSEVGIFSVPSVRAQFRLILVSILVLFCGILVCTDVFGSSFTLVAMPRRTCCECHSSHTASCSNCKCVKAGRACVNCELSRNGLCKNEFGHAELQPSRSFQCPFPTCNEGVGKRPVTRRVEDVSRLRMHVSTHVGFVPSTDWLTLTKSRICPGSDFIGSQV